MKTLAITLALAAFTLIGYCDAKSRAQGMVNSEKHSQTTKQAESNFTTKCAANYRWCNTTNQIAKSSAKIEQLRSQETRAKEKARLAFRAGQATSANSPEAQQIAREMSAEEKRLAASRLEKMQIEDGIRTYSTKKP